MFRIVLLSIILWFNLSPVATAQSLPGAARLDQLFSALNMAAEDEWQVIEDEIWQLWGRSGSPSMDLLLKRGQAAMAAEENVTAIEHFTALIDHAPAFAEGWNARATAYFTAGLYGPALADIRQTLALEPRHFGALSGLGLILEEMGENAGALAAYRAVLTIHPYREDVHQAIARMKRAVGEIDA